MDLWNYRTKRLLNWSFWNFFVTGYSDQYSKKSNYKFPIIFSWIFRNITSNLKKSSCFPLSLSISWWLDLKKKNLWNFKMIHLNIFVEEIAGKIHRKPRISIKCNVFICFFENSRMFPETNILDYFFWFWNSLRKLKEILFWL